MKAHTSSNMETSTTEIFKKIYNEESDSIFRFCLIRVSNREQALDITQETFLRLWKSLLEDEKILNNRAFLFTVARHLIVDWYRKKKSTSLDALMDNKTKPFDVIDEKMTNEIEVGAEGRYLIDKINELSPDFRDPVYLRFVENLLPQEIAAILNISANTASVRITRGLEELRKKAGYNKLKK